MRDRKKDMIFHLQLVNCIKIGYDVLVFVLVLVLFNINNTTLHGVAQKTITVLSMDFCKHNLEKLNNYYLNQYFKELCANIPSM